MPQQYEPVIEIRNESIDENVKVTNAKPDAMAIRLNR